MVAYTHSSRWNTTTSRTLTVVVYTGHREQPKLPERPVVGFWLHSALLCPGASGRPQSAVIGGLRGASGSARPEPAVLRRWMMMVVPRHGGRDGVSRVQWTTDTIRRPGTGTWTCWRRRRGGTWTPRTRMAWHRRYGRLTTGTWRRCGSSSDEGMLPSAS